MPVGAGRQLGEARDRQGVPAAVDAVGDLHRGISRLALPDDGDERDAVPVGVTNPGAEAAVEGRIDP